MQIKADTRVCVGSGQCVLTEPTVFDQGDDGIVVLLTDRPYGEAEGQARNAVNLCPSQALSIVDQ
jgi:ferredoxin